jgi:hypothetical protein
VLALKPDSPEKFNEFLARSDSQVDVDVRFAAVSPEQGEWAIVPHADPGMVVKFGIPQLLESWLLTERGLDRERVEQMKTVLLPYITVFHHGNRITQLRYRKVPAPPGDLDLYRAGSLDLRHRLMDPDFAFRPEGRSSWDYTRSEPTSQRPLIAELAISDRIHKWTREGAAELLRLLSEKGLVWQVDVILAAASETDGKISRERVLQLGRRRGWQAGLDHLVRPIGAVLRELKSEGVVASHAIPPLRSVRKNGQISSYEVPKEFIEFLNQAAIGQ